MPHNWYAIVTAHLALGISLAVGQRTLNPNTEVRILHPQPDFSGMCAGKLVSELLDRLTQIGIIAQELKKTFNVEQKLDTKVSF